MSIINDATRNNQNWNTQSRIDLSRNLAQAYCPGLNTVKSNEKADTWTTQKFIDLSRSLSSAYGIDF
jgi:hypothetical protein